MTARTRVGTVRYLNSAPLTSDLDPARYELVADHPRGIAEALRRGDVALALAPVAAVLGVPELRVLPGHCIGASGPVRSVLLVAETEPEAWTEVLLDGESRTSVVLARLLAARSPLAARLRPDLKWTFVAPGAAPASATGATAAVVIGDAARALDDRFTVRLDLAELWTAWTGLPFVFAVWAGRADVPAEVRADVVAAGHVGVAAIAGRFTGADADYLLHAIRYPLDEPALMGLRRFAALAAAEGLLPDGQVRLFDPPRRWAARDDGLEGILAEAARGILPADPGRLLRGADRAALSLAAHVRRAALHPAATATYLVAAYADGADDDAWTAAQAVPHVAAIYTSDLGALPPAQRAARLAAGVDVAAPADDGPGAAPPADRAAHVLTTVAAFPADDAPAGVAAGLSAARAATNTAVSADDAALGGLTAVTWRPLRPLPVVPSGAVLHADLGLDDPSDDAFLTELAAVRAAGDAVLSVAVHLPLPEGALVDPARPTPDRWLRRVSVARLALSVPHIVASPSTQGLDASQLALCCGADDLGPVGPGLPTPDLAAPFTASLEAAERALAVAGLRAVRRDLLHQPVGDAVTRLRTVRRPEERARP